jgi:hypothetical protein
MTYSALRARQLENKRLLRIIKKPLSITPSAGFPIA